MRHATTPQFFELTSEGGQKTISITPSASIQSGKFNVSGVPARSDDMRMYSTRYYPHVQFDFNADAAGNAVSWDKLAKVLNSAELISPILGTVYPKFHTQGPTLMHIIDVVALAYQYPQGARTQIPANTDATYTVDMFYVLPIAHDFLVDQMETAQWTGFFDGGSLELDIAASTVFDGDYAGAVTESVVLRCIAEAMPSPREFLGVPFQWRRRQIQGGGQSPLLKNVGGETSLNGVRPGCGLVGMYWLTDATGMGLGGPDGVDNITSITLDWRRQKNIQNLDPFFHFARSQSEKRISPISEGAGAALLDATEWPSSMSATAANAQNRPSANPQMMCLPIVTPGRMLHTSKLQRLLGDIQVDYNFTATFSTPHEFMTCEFLEWTTDQANAMAQLGLFQGQSARKSATGGGGKASNFRYTAIEFVDVDPTPAG